MSFLPERPMENSSEWVPANVPHAGRVNLPKNLDIKSYLKLYGESLI